MDLFGNQELLKLPLVAFFASRSSSSEVYELALRWAHEVSATDRVVISGFHSPVERAVLDVLLQHNRPVVVALGRSLYRRIPNHLRCAYDENRLLFISFRHYVRHSLSNSQLRNWAIAELASEAVFAPFQAESQLSTLYHFLSQSSITAHILQ